MKASESRICFYTENEEGERTKNKNKLLQNNSPITD